MMSGMTMSVAPRYLSSCPQVPREYPRAPESTVEYPLAQMAATSIPHGMVSHVTTAGRLTRGCRPTRGGCGTTRSAAARSADLAPKRSAPSQHHRTLQHGCIVATSSHVATVLQHHRTLQHGRMLQHLCSDALQPSPGADAAGVHPVLAQMCHWPCQVPAQMPVPVQVGQR